MSGFQSLSGFSSASLPDGGVSGAVGSGTEDCRVQVMVLYSFHDMFDNIRFKARFKRLCLVFKVQQVSYQ